VNFFGDHAISDSLIHHFTNKKTTLVAEVTCLAVKTGHVNLLNWSFPLKQGSRWRKWERKLMVVSSFRDISRLDSATEGHYNSDLSYTLFHLQNTFVMVKQSFISNFNTRICLNVKYFNDL